MELLYDTDAIVSNSCPITLKIYFGHLPVPSVRLQCAEQMWQCLWNARSNLIFKQNALFPEKVFNWRCFPPVHLQSSSNDLYVRRAVSCCLWLRDCKRELQSKHPVFCTTSDAAPLLCHLLVAP